jgi:PAS domain S-box-containing protein
LTIAQRGLLLVAIPLLSEVIFVTVLAFVHSSTMKEIEQINSRRAICDNTNVLLGDLFRAGTFTLEHPPTNENLRTLLKEIKDRIYVLERLVKDNPQQLQIIRMAKESIPLLEVIVADYEARGPISGKNHKVILNGRVEDFSEIRRRALLRMSSPELITMADEERQQQVADSQRLAATRSSLWAILAGGLLFCTVVTVGALRILSQGLSDRLQVMTNNAWRMAADVPLLPTVGGNDEIANLDRVFHMMHDALDESKHRERAIVENAANVICSIDAKGLITNVSPASVLVLGYKPEELLEQPALNIVASHLRSEAAQTFSRIIGSTSPSSMESQFKRKDGTIIDVLCAMQWSPEEKSLFCVIHDITAQKDTERMKQEVVSMVTHDLRTPLTTIRHFLEMLESGMLGSLTDNGSSLVAAADRNANRMLALINDLLDIEKIKAGMMEIHPEESSLADIFEQSAQSVMAFADDRKVKIVTVPTYESMFVDSNRIIRVLVNLLGNAIKFSPADSTITVKAESLDDAVVISVADQGRGIPEHMIESIFDSFQQVKDSDASEKGGSGLGLSICKAIVELHGGKISVRSQEGKGSTFSLTIPRHCKSVVQERTT